MYSECFLNYFDSSISKITELERSAHKHEQNSCREIAKIPWDISHVVLEDVVIKLLNKIDVKLTKMILWFVTDLKIATGQLQKFSSTFT